MVFSSNIFMFAFLPLCLGGYYILPKKLRNAFLTLASLCFYAWGEPRMVWVMLCSIIINYCGGLLLSAFEQKTAKRAAMVLVVVLNLGLLGYFKYANFFVDSVNAIAGTHIALAKIALPIGISFFTFQGMSYVLDVYMGTAKVQRNPLHIMLYISLFPQLVAGPIVRYQDISEQIAQREVTTDAFFDGIWRFAVGLGKKVLLANQFASIADEIFGRPIASNSVAVAWLGAIAYTMQIYFDFCGYSDMAIGLGKMLGFRFCENFNYPYISRSVTEFWRRWHISLSTWFRDYVYIPLGGNRRGNQYFHLIVVFLLTGLWHGAAWNFVLWGLWHGAFLIAEKVLLKRKIPIKVPSLVQWLYTMGVVVLGWILFRANSPFEAIQYVRRMVGLKAFVDGGYTLGWYLHLREVLLLVAAVLACVPWKKVFPATAEKLHATNTGLVLKCVLALALLLSSIALLMTGTYNPFIYFRF